MVDRKTFADIIKCGNIFAGFSDDFEIVLFQLRHSSNKTQL